MENKRNRSRIVLYRIRTSLSVIFLRCIGDVNQWVKYAWIKCLFLKHYKLLIWLVSKYLSKCIHGWFYSRPSRPRFASFWRCTLKMYHRLWNNQIRTWSATRCRPPSPDPIVSPAFCSSRGRLPVASIDSRTPPDHPRYPAVSLRPRIAGTDNRSFSLCG